MSNEAICIRWYLKGQLRVGTGEEQSLTVEDGQYGFIVPSLECEEGYYQGIEAITIEDSPNRIICVRKIKYVKSLKLPVWGTPIPFRKIGGIGSPGSAPPWDISAIPHSKFICPIWSRE